MVLTSGSNAESADYSRRLVLLRVPRAPKDTPEEPQTEEALIESSDFEITGVDDVLLYIPTILKESLATWLSIFLLL